MGEQRGSLVQGCKGFENKGIRGRGGLDVMREGEVEDIEDHRIREDGSVCIIGSGTVTPKTLSIFVSNTVCTV